MKILPVPAVLAAIAVTSAFFAAPTLALCQVSPAQSATAGSTPQAASAPNLVSTDPAPSSTAVDPAPSDIRAAATQPPDSSAPLTSSASNATDTASSTAGLPAAPEPAVITAGNDGWDPHRVAPSAFRHLEPFSKVAAGFGLGSLGINIKGAIDINQNFDLRAMVSFFDFSSPSFDITGFTVTSNTHFASAITSLDWYPWGSGFRVSPGVMLFNQNQISATSQISPGTSFSIGNTTYFSANPNPVTGAVPLQGSGTLGLHTYQPAPTLTLGFGTFVPRSGRHWSFPSEFGVAYTGAPTINVKTSGWICLDYQQKMCSDVTNLNQPVGLQFQQSLTAQVEKWRNDLQPVKFFPILSSSVVYSFNIR